MDIFEKFFHIWNICDPMHLPINVWSCFGKNSESWYSLLYIQNTKCLQCPNWARSWTANFFNRVSPLVHYILTMWIWTWRYSSFRNLQHNPSQDPVQEAVFLCHHDPNDTSHHARSHFLSRLLDQVRNWSSKSHYQPHHACLCFF